MSTKLSDRNKKLTLIPDPQSPDTAGFITTTADDVVPPGWLECNGQAVSTTTYPELFALIGYTYGGSGGTFNLPGGDLANHRITDKTTDGSILILADTSMTSDNLTIDTGNTVTVNSGANLNSLDTLIVDGTLVAGGTVKTGSLVNATDPTFTSVTTDSITSESLQTYWQKKSLSTTLSASDADIADMKFNNLTVGKSYSLRASAYFNSMAAINSQCLIDAEHDSANLFRITARNGSVDQGVREMAGGNSIVFTATATVVSFSFTRNTAGNLVADFTYAVLEELPNHTQTNKFD